MAEGSLDLLGGNLINKGVIGEGAFGVVYLVENCGTEYAVKIMDCSDDSGSVADNEVKVHKELSHDNVVVYVESFVQDGLVYIVSEFCAGGDLSSFLDQAKNPVPEDLLVAWLWQMSCGLEYMHMKNPPVLHRDLKPSNIYLTEQGDLRLGDMGIARILDSTTAMAQTFCGTPPYMSPEALQAEPYNDRTDIWALGCCVVEMATLERAYQGSSIFILRSVVNKKREPLPLEYSRTLDALVSEMLLQDYRERISATRVLDSDLLQKCEERSEPPLSLLQKHDMLKFLRSEKAVPTLRSETTRHTLQDSMASLTKILTNKEILTDYRRRAEQRAHGRDWSTSGHTLVNPETMKSVLHDPGKKTANKTVKRAPIVPSIKPSRVTDDSMWTTLTASFRNIMLDSMTNVKPAVAPRVERKQKPPPGKTGEPASPSAPDLMTLLKDILSRYDGDDALQRIRTLVLSPTTSTSKLQTTLRTMVIDTPEWEALTQIIVIVVLQESIRKK